MPYEWDETKRQSNLDRHGIDFPDIEYFDWDNAWIFEDTRRDYGEQRWVAYGYINHRLIAVVYTERDGRTRMISMRKANAREERRYG